MYLSVNIMHCIMRTFTLKKINGLFGGKRAISRFTMAIY